jgi:hypothetical protein
MLRVVYFIISEVLAQILQPDFLEILLENGTFLLMYALFKPKL